MPSADDVKPAAVNAGGSEVYTVTVAGKEYVVQVEEGGDISKVVAAGAAQINTAAAAPAPVASSGAGEPVCAPLAGNIFKVLVAEGQAIQDGDVLIILEAMKMETEIRAHQAGIVGGIRAKVGDSVSVGDVLLTLN